MDNYSALFEYSEVMHAVSISLMAFCGSRPQVQGTLVGTTA
jgi:hypothetical protein